MSRHQRIKHLFVCALIPLSLAQCGKDGKSSQVKLEIRPGEPIVIDSPTKVDGTDALGPWFVFDVYATNESDETVTIVAMKLEITIVNEFGVEQRYDYTFAPSTKDTSVTDTSGAEIQCSYTKYAELAPNASGYFELDLNNDCPAYRGFKPVGLPKVSGSFRYRAKITPQGWFGPYTKANDRFERSYTFFTR